MIKKIIPIDNFLGIIFTEKEERQLKIKVGDEIDLSDVIIKYKGGKNAK